MIGVDIGGSGVRGAVVKSGASVEMVSVDLRDRSVSAVVNTVAQMVASMGPVRSVGISVPGFIRGEHIIASPNFPEWHDVPIGRLLRESLGVPVAVENDGNAAALGAWQALGGAKDVVLLTLGTGVGGGVVTSGNLLRGAGGTAAELGHMYVGGNRCCPCGGVGCLETWLSTRGLCEAAVDYDEHVESARQVIDAADGGAEWAVQVCDAAASALGRGLVTLINVFNPDVVVLAGGLAQAAHRFAPVVESELKRAISPSIQRVEVLWGRRAEDYAIPGVALVARQAARL